MGKKVNKIRVLSVPQRFADREKDRVQGSAAGTTTKICHKEERGIVWPYAFSL
jgi:hypothetical protein